MKQELYYISPRIVEADCVQEITIRGKFPHSDLRGFQGGFTIDSVRADGLFTNNEIPGFTSGNGYDLGRPDYEEIKDVSFDADGVLRFRYPFAGEGENYFRVRIADRVLFVFGIGINARAVLTFVVVRAEDSGSGRFFSAHYFVYRFKMLSFGVGN